MTSLAGYSSRVRLLRGPFVKQLRSPMRRLVVALGLSVMLTGCGESPTSPSHFAAFAQTDLRSGTGSEAVSSSRLTVHYTLWLYNATTANNKGVQVESSIGATPFTFVLGSGDVIEGWNRGLAGMRVGGLRRLVVPPSLAYGAERNGIIPPYATLLFEIELVEIASS
jgi:FKBP-type peptidyl-prolyl cis-trans isomerase FkpA